MNEATQETASDEQEPTKVNASTRLYDFLSNLSNIGSPAPTGHAIAMVLGLSPNTKEVMKASTVLYRMFEAADREIEYYLSKDASFYLSPINEIREAISVLKWGASWNDMKRGLSGVHLTHVLHTAKRMNELSPECLLKADDIAGIFKAIEDLELTIEELDLSRVAKHKLRQRCAALRYAVEEYKFWGIEEIEVAFETAHGAMIPFVEKDKQGKTTKTWKRIGAALIVISGFLGKANSTYKTVHESFQLLESGIEAVAERAEPVVEAIEAKLLN
jgi:hypothetical protein